MQKTAMDLMIDCIKENGTNFSYQKILSRAMELKDAVEKEQIIDSFVSGCTNSSFDIEYGILAEQHYIKTYIHKTTNLNKMILTNKDPDYVYAKNLAATAHNLLLVFKHKQWERLESKVWDFENAIELFENRILDNSLPKAEPTATKQGEQDKR